MSVQCPYCGGPMEYLTVSQVAGLLGVSKKTIRAYVRKGRFPGTELVTDHINTRSAFKIPATAVLPLVKEYNGNLSN